MKYRIDNVPTDATEHDIRELFSGYGKVLSVTLRPVPLYSKQLRTGLIELENVSITETGIFADRCLFKESTIRITLERSTTDTQAATPPAEIVGPEELVPRRPDNIDRNTLRVISVEEVVDPDTGKPNGWCGYSIRSHTGTITGLRQGSVAEVTLHAEEAAEAYNLRNVLGHCRVRPTWSSRNKKSGT